MIHPRFILRSLATGAALLAPLVCGACGSTDDDPEGPGQKTEAFCSSSENTAPEFSVGMNEMGSDDKFRVAIEAAEPATPILGKNTWTIKVTDAAGTPVDDANISIRCSMPGHTHGCAVIPTVSYLGDGLYEIDPLRFNMSKNWNVTFTVKSADGTETDNATLGVCIG